MKGVSKPTPDRSKIDTQNAKELKYWVKALGTSQEILLLAIEKVGNSAATVRKELERRALSEAPLKPDDFPVSTDGKQIKKNDGTTIADAGNPVVAVDVAERLNEDEARREEDKWSA